LKSLPTIAKQISARFILVLTLYFVLHPVSAQYSKLLNFAGGTEAKSPSGTLTTDGIYLYGVTTGGGSANMGTIYKTKQDGTGYVKLLDFTGLNGNFPEGSLYYDGTFLYGMTYLGGTSNFGVIYKIMPDGSNYQKLLDFDGTNGHGPYGLFVSDGTYLYAMTWEGGANDLGRIFKIKPDGTGYQGILDFNLTNGSYPASSLYYDGALYGMTSQGGANGVGTVFRINTNGTGYVNLHDFSVGTDGREPYGALISDGTYLYGTTYFGGTSDFGTVFRLLPDGTNYQKIVDFSGSSTGKYPYTTLTLSGKYLYGHTNQGGFNNLGVLFKVKADGSGFTMLMSLAGSSNGASPGTTLLSIGPYLYGITSAGGTSGNGTMFRFEVEEAFTKLLDFTGPINGLIPYGSLYSDGTFLYGMTEEGGANDLGTIFRIKPDGTDYKKLLDFSGVVNGSSPQGSLISDGAFLYGMTHSGGTLNLGTIFKIMPDGTGYSKLHEFSAVATGVYPQSDLFYDGTALYGMTPSGGANNRGTFFKIMPDGSGYTKLSDFGAPFDGTQPRGSLYHDGTSFYGTTYAGGSANMGTIFKIMPDGTNLTKLLDFGVGTNGRYPEASFSSDGTYLFGSTSQGGTNNYGSLFKIKPDGTDYTTLVDFDNSIYGSSPQGTPLIAGDFLYGLTYVGGPDFEGTIFKVKKDGSNFKTVHEFSGVASGSYPLGCSLISDGTYFYGMTNNGGLVEGTVFRLKDIPANTTLLDFDGTANGAAPTYGKLICDGTNLYGMTTEGGTADAGVVFKIGSDGTSFNKLHDFGVASFDGEFPYGSLCQEETFLYGMTLRGGTTGDGTIFKVMPDGTGYVKLFNFNGATTGTDPSGALTADGTFLYGVTSQGGSSGRGTIFKILEDGTGFTKLHDFAANTGYAVGDLTLVGTTLYGMTFYGGVDNDGTVFKIGTDGTGFTVIHEFGFPDGISPYTGALVYDGTFLYGMTELGGTDDEGIVFKIKPDGTSYTTLHNFVAPTAGIPLGALEIVGSSLYGLTYEGGPNDMGTLFTVGSDGSGYQTLMEFDGITNGYDVLGTLCHCGDALFGMTTGGGTNDLGTIFKYVLPTATSALATIAITVDGSGLANGTTLNFSSLVVGEAETKDFVITNDGTATLTIGATSVTGDFSIQGTAPTSITAGGNQTLTLQFLPTQAGTRSGTITFSSNGDTPNYAINLSGSGIAAIATLEVTEDGTGHGSGSGLEFSSTDIGNGESKEIVITNTGNAALVITEIQVSGDFAIVGDVPSSIAPGASATLTVQFTPTAAGAREGTMTIVSNGDTPVFVLNLTGTGEVEIEVFNVVTVNANGKHDFLKIRNITFFPDNSVSIFDRWGNKVFETDRYDNAGNVFKGENEKGKDLPEGTYFYVIHKNNGDKPFTGFILLRK
jgi:gliding motility-associated-like protein